MDFTAYFSPQELSTWSAQRDTLMALGLTSTGIRFAFLVAVLVFGCHLSLRTFCERVADWLYTRPSLFHLGNAAPALRRLVAAFERLSAGKSASARVRRQWLVDAFYPVAFVLLWTVMATPLTFFASYVLDHEWGLSAITLSRWFLDWARELFILVLCSLALGLGLFGLARRLPRSWWLWLSGVVLGMLLGWSMLSPLRARLSNDFTPLPEGELRRSISQMVMNSGFTLEQVQVVNSSLRSNRANAYIQGQGPSKEVVLGDNLVNEFPAREIGVAVAHEIGHQINDHPLRGWLTTGLGALVFLAFVRMILWLAPRFQRLGIRKNADPAALPVVILALHLLNLANTPLSSWMDREEEWQADSAALQLTNDPVAYTSLMVRLNRINQTDVDPPAFWHWFYSHHPTTAQRIRFGIAWAREHNIRFEPAAIPLPAPEMPLVRFPGR